MFRSSSFYSTNAAAYGFWVYETASTCLEVVMHCDQANARRQEYFTKPSAETIGRISEAVAQYIGGKSAVMRLNSWRAWLLSPV